MLIGTPIPMLQISETVMQMIGSDLANGFTASRFTQDGLHLAQLADKVSELDFKCVQSVESEVMALSTFGADWGLSEKDTFVILLLF